MMVRADRNAWGRSGVVGPRNPERIFHEARRRFCSRFLGAAGSRGRRPRHGASAGRRTPSGVGEGCHCSRTGRGGVEAGGRDSSLQTSHRRAPGAGAAAGAGEAADRLAARSRNRLRHNAARFADRRRGGRKLRQERDRGGWLQVGQEHRCRAGWYMAGASFARQDGGCFDGRSGRPGFDGVIRNP